MPPRGINYDRIWDALIMTSAEDDIQERTGYSHREIVQAHLEIFLSMPGMTEATREETRNLWGDYIVNMVNGTNQGRRIEFFGDVGTTDRTFNWAQWRLAMGYGRAQ